MKSYFRFLAHQLKGWPQQNYYLFFFSLGCQIMTLVNSPITWLSIVAFIGTNLGVLCILSINAAKSVNGSFRYIICDLLYYCRFFRKNYLSIGEQIAYMITFRYPSITK